MKNEETLNTKIENRFADLSQGYLIRHIINVSDRHIKKKQLQQLG